MMNNQTISFLPAELFFSMGRLAAISSLLLIVLLVFIIIFLLFYQQRNTSQFDEHELNSETDPSIIENRVLELSNFKQYASTDNNNQLRPSSINSTHTDIDEQKTRSTMNLISSKDF